MRANVASVSLVVCSAILVRCNLRWTKVSTPLPSPPFPLEETKDQVFPKSMISLSAYRLIPEQYTSAIGKYVGILRPCCESGPTWYVFVPCSVRRPSGPLDEYFSPVVPRSSAWHRNLMVWIRAVASSALDCDRGWSFEIIDDDHTCL